MAAAVFLALPACRTVLLDDRFEGADLKRWTVIDDPDTVEGPSAWRVESDGWLHQRSNIWGRRGDFLGRWYGTMIVAGDPEWRDYKFSVRVRPRDDDGFGVVFRFQDPHHFYRLLLIDDGMNGGPLVRLDKREGADYTELWSRASRYKIGAESQIEIDVEGNRLRGHFDGEALFDLEDGAFRTGRIGLFCYAQSDQAFDEVRVVGH
jgi:hypothetical protein